MKLIYIDKESLRPIYQQIVESIEDAISSKRLFRNDRLPSVNKICLEHNVSRDTVFLAYEKLKQKGIIKSHVSQTFAFDEMEKAHLQLETGRTVGKIVITV